MSFFFLIMDLSWGLTKFQVQGTYIKESYTQRKKNSGKLRLKEIDFLQKLIKYSEVNGLYFQLCDKNKAF